MHTNIPIAELISRQSKVLEKMDDNSAFMIFSNELIARNADVEYPFRQDSNFWYLTGLNQDQSVLILTKKNGVNSTVIFTPTKNPSVEKWLGKKLSKEEVSNISGIENIFWFEELENELKSVFSGLTKLFFDQTGSYSELRARVVSMLSKNGRRTIDENLLTLEKTGFILGSLRVIKSNWEIEQMQKASDFNVLAHQFAYKNLKQAFLDGVNYGEKQFEADLYYYYNKNSLTWSYPAIVANGANGCILHYGQNNDDITGHDLVLVDAGCEYNYYASDITRCYLPQGKFSLAQKEVYELVLKANKQVIEFLASGSATYSSYHQKAVSILSQGLIDMGILNQSLDEAMQTKSYFKYFPHGVGHWIGLDVHDQSKYLDISGNRIDTKFESGMAVTVEPGLYFDLDDLTIPAQYRGIAIRIEDDIVITKDGVLNLTRNLPKEIEELENF